MTKYQGSSEVKKNVQQICNIFSSARWMLADKKNDMHDEEISVTQILI